MHNARNISGSGLLETAERINLDQQEARSTMTGADHLSCFFIQRAPNDQVRREILNKVRDPVVPQEVRALIAPSEVRDGSFGETDRLKRHL